MKSCNRFFVLAIDFITINLSWLVFSYLRVDKGWWDLFISIDFLIPMTVVYLYWLLIFLFIGMYRTWFALSRFDEISTLLKASFFGVMILFSLIFMDDYSHGVESPNRFLILIYLGIFFVFVSVGRVSIRSFQRNLLIKGFGRRNAVVVGFNEKSKEIADQIIKHKGLGLDVLGFVVVKEENLQKEYKGINAIGHIREIEQIINEKSIQEIVIVLEKHDEDLLIDLIGKCEGKNVGLKIVPDLYEILSGQARTAQLYGFPLIDINPQLMPEWEYKVKRIIDIFWTYSNGRNFL